MSFKHAQLQDSIIGRSYVKIAQEKGWVQEEPLKKEASAPDFHPTTNLMENILKLCRGLRQSGFDKYAEELESKFVQFKQANCHYDVSGETGEDLIHAAHPKGSHKLEGVDSDEGTIETVLDQHMKILEKIQKMPHGKLSTASEIIDAVKVVLAQSHDDVKKKLDSAYANTYAAYEAATIAGKLNPLTNFELKKRVIWLSNIASRPTHEVSLRDLGGAAKYLHEMQEIVKPGLFMMKGITDPAVLKTVNAYLDAATKDFSDAGEMIKKIVVAPTETKSAPAEQYTTINPVDVQSFTNPILKNIEERTQNLIDSLDSYKLLGKVSKNTQALTYINDQEKELRDFLGRLYRIPAERRDAMAPAMQKELEQYEGFVEEFERDWVKGGK